MIRTKGDLELYLESDRIAYNQPVSLPLNKKLRQLWLRNGNTAYQYMRVLRKLEYYSRIAYNSKNLWKKLVKNVYHRRLLTLRKKTDMYLETGTIGAGAYIPYGHVIITPLARIGDNVVIESYVTIGITNGVYKGPRIGNNVFIGTGAKIIGDIEIADGVCIGANAVVVKDVVEKNVTVGGIPAKKISDKGTAGYCKDAVGMAKKTVKG